MHAFTSLHGWPWILVTDAAVFVACVAAKKEKKILKQVHHSPLAEKKSRITKFRFNEAKHHIIQFEGCWGHTKISPIDVLIVQLM